MNKLKTFIKTEMVFCISFLLAIISCFFTPPSIEYFRYIDFKVLSCLFSLMVVVKTFEEMNLFKFLGNTLLKKASNTRLLGFIVIYLCFFSSMFITNDVALITFVPFTLVVLTLSKKLNYAILIVVLQTVAANLGSSLTPVGNPQNLYIYSFYNLSPMEFFKITLPLVVFSGLLLLFSMLFIKKEPIEYAPENIINLDIKRLSSLISLFILSILAVFDVLSYTLVFFIILVVFFIMDKSIFKKVDYSLLFTFICFFIFVGNISNVQAVKDFLHNILSGKELISSIIISQGISNVPAAVLLSGFTNNYKSLLLGVNIGGCGSLVASLASLISYKIFIKEVSHKKSTYLKYFSIINILFLAVLIVFAIFIY